MNMTKRILGKWLHLNGIEVRQILPGRYMAMLSSGGNCYQLHLYIRSDNTCLAIIMDADLEHVEAQGLSNICKLIKLHNTN